MAAMRSSINGSGLEDPSAKSSANDPAEDILVRCDLGVLRPRVGATTYTLQLILYPPDKKKKVFRTHISKSGIQIFDVDDPIKILFKHLSIYYFEVTTPDLDYEVPDGFFRILHKDVVNCIYKTGIYTHACSVIGDADQDDISFDLTYYHKTKTRFYSKDRITYTPAKVKPPVENAGGAPPPQSEEVQKSSNPKLRRSSAGAARRSSAQTPTQQPDPLTTSIRRDDKSAQTQPRAVPDQNVEVQTDMSRSVKSSRSRGPSQSFDVNHINVNTPISTKSIIENLRSSGFDIVPSADSPLPVQRRCSKHHDIELKGANFVLSPSPARGTFQNSSSAPLNLPAQNTSQRREDIPVDQGRPPLSLSTPMNTPVAAETKRFTYNDFSSTLNAAPSQETGNFPPY